MPSAAGPKNACPVPPNAVSRNTTRGKGAGRGHQSHAPPSPPAPSTANAAAMSEPLAPRLGTAVFTGRLSLARAEVANGFRWRTPGLNSACPELF